MGEHPPLTFVLDTGPVVALDRLGYGSCLARGLIGAAVIPTTVAEELRRGAPRPGAGLTERLQVIPTPESVLSTLVCEYRIPSAIHRGELGVIALTRALRSRTPALDARAVLDDLPARKLASRAGLTPSAAMTGTLGLLTVIHDAGLGAAPLPEEIDLLQRTGYRFSAALVKRALNTPPTRREDPVAERWRREVRVQGSPARRKRAPSPRDRSIG